MKIVKVNNLPQTYEADTIYLVKSSTAGLVDIYVTDNIGTQIRSLAVDAAVINSLLPISEVGVSVASLVDGKVPTNQLPSAILGALTYQGTWNASTNNPAIPAASPSNKGWYYVVNVSGTTSIDGENDWVVGDWVVSSGSSWSKVDNSDKVSSVAGKTGVVTLVKADILDLGNVDNTSDLNKPISTAQQAALNLKAPLTGEGTSGTWSISVSGSSNRVASALTIKPVADLPHTWDAGISVRLANNVAGFPAGAYSGIITSRPWTVGYGTLQLNHAYNSNVAGIWYRQSINSAGDWTVWRKLVDSVDIGTYSPSLTGAGASGNWGISVTGNAATASKLATARSINGVNFDGSANITVADATKLPLTGGTMTGAITFAGAQTWPTFNQSTTGNAATATKLATARTINGVGFDGSANISVPVGWSSVTGKPAVIAAGTDAAAARAAIGAASLVGGKIPEHELPALAITDVFPVASEAAMLALTAEKGDIAIRSDLNKCFALSAAPASTLANWLELKTPANAVLSVAGRTGAITLSSSDVGLGNVNNTSDANKPVSTATQTALNLKANLANPALTGVPTAPTAAVGTNTTQIATTAFVLANVGSSSSGGGEAFSAF